MNNKLLSGLCAAVLLSGLVGCGPKESKQDTTTSTSTKETKNNTTNNSEVTEKTSQRQMKSTSHMKNGKKVMLFMAVVQKIKLSMYQKPLMENQSLRLQSVA